MKTYIEKNRLVRLFLEMKFTGLVCPGVKGLGKNVACVVGTECDPSSERIGDLFETGRETGSASGFVGEGELRRFVCSTATGTGRVGTERSDSRPADVTGF